MKLTEREKWLMQEAWNSARARTDCDNMQEWLDIVDYDSIIESILRNAPKPESIVKTVDPDNLPECDVIGIEGDELCAGFFEDYDQKPRILYNFDNMLTPTHYIEQKDLIDLIMADGK